MLSFVMNLMRRSTTWKKELVMSTPRAATIYYESNESTGIPGVNILTRGIDKRGGDKNLNNKSINVKAGRLFIGDLPDWGKNECFLEVTTVTRDPNNLGIATQFKLQAEIKDDTSSANIQGVTMIRNAKVKGGEISLQVRLTEIDKIDEEKLSLIKNFAESNSIADVANSLLASTPVDYKEAVKTLFNAAELIDKLNDDDRIWIERPDLSVRDDADFPLYDGNYAIVTTPENQELPIKLYIASNDLYTSYASDIQNTPFRLDSFFTLKIQEVL